MGTESKPRPDHELVVPGPVPFDRLWLMRRLRLLDRWMDGTPRSKPRPVSPVDTP